MVESVFKKTANENLSSNDGEIEKLKEKIEQQKGLLERAADVLIKEVNKQKVDEISKSVYTPQTEAKAAPAPKDNFGKLVMVTWFDVSNYQAEWISRSEIEDLEPAKNRSVGWLIKEARDYIVLAPTYSSNTDMFCGVVTISRSAITEIRDIDCGEDKKQQGWSDS